MSWKKVKLNSVLRQYRIEHWIQNDVLYKQVTISKYNGVSYRGQKLGTEIGRKRQFIIDLEKYPNTLLFIRQGVQEGGIGIAPLEVHGCIVTENMPMFSIENIEVDYLNYLIQAPLFKNELNKLVPTGSAQKAIHERQLLEIEIPLPSKVEQEAIIFRLNHFENHYKEIQKEIEQQQSYIQLLHQTILQEAVQGKLTQQDEADEPASELLKRIKAEKQKLIKEGKLKKEKELPSITDDEIPFELPKGWGWCRLNDIAYVGNGSTPDKSQFTNNSTDIPYLKVYNLVNQKVNFLYKPQYIKPSCHYGQLKRSITYSGDVLMNIVGPPLGKVALVPSVIKECNINQAIVVIRPFIQKLNEWIYWFLCEQSAINSIVTKGTAGQDNISVTQSRNLAIPLPPFHEQQRIVAKVQQLQQQLNLLENQVQQSKQYAQQLLQSVLKEAFEGKANEYVGNEELPLAAEPINSL